ncbi:hypothetical protein B5E42_03890 [Flavonifractor sp. An10]|nr:hypothetical protein B5E42_03890 [Flavonifractor sp. An10]
MSIIKFKMYGGDLEITEGVTVAECEYCGTKQTVPRQKQPRNKVYLHLSRCEIMQADVFRS